MGFTYDCIFFRWLLCNSQGFVQDILTKSRSDSLRLFSTFKDLGNECMLSSRHGKVKLFNIAAGPAFLRNYFQLNLIQLKSQLLKKSCNE